MGNYKKRKKGGAYWKEKIVGLIKSQLFIWLSVTDLSLTCTKPKPVILPFSYSLEIG